MSKDLVPKNQNHRPMLTREEFQALAEVPAELEWFANLENALTKRWYADDLRDFMQFVGIREPHEFRIVTRSHIIAWRDNLKQRVLGVVNGRWQPVAHETARRLEQSGGKVKHGYSGSTIRRKLSALSSLFEYLCDANAVTHNPVKGVKRPREESYDGLTPAISDEQVRKLLKEPPETTLKGKRDRAILASLFFQGLRRQELCNLRVRDYTKLEGVDVFVVRGKRSKIRRVEVAPITQQYLAAYMAATDHAEDLDGPLFRPVRNHVGDKSLDKPLNPKSVYTDIVLYYARRAGITAETPGFTTHSSRVTSGTNAWDNGVDLAELQAWYGHENISTTRKYIRRRPNIAKSPTYKINYDRKPGTPPREG
jgi:integrase/recombinase XerD